MTLLFVCLSDSLFEIGFPMYSGNPPAPAFHALGLHTCNTTPGITNVLVCNDGIVERGAVPASVQALSALRSLSPRALVWRVSAPVAWGRPKIC